MNDMEQFKIAFERLSYLEELILTYGVENTRTVNALLWAIEDVKVYYRQIEDLLDQ